MQNPQLHSFTQDKDSLSYKLRKYIQYGDKPWSALLISMSAVVVLLMLAIGWLIWSGSAEARHLAGFSFILPTSDASWNPVAEQFQAWPFIYGT